MGQGSLKRSPEKVSPARLSGPAKAYLDASHELCLWKILTVILKKGSTNDDGTLCTNQDRPAMLDLHARIRGEYYIGVLRQRVFVAVPINLAHTWVRVTCVGEINGEW